MYDVLSKTLIGVLVAGELTAENIENIIVYDQIAKVLALAAIPITSGIFWV